MKLLPVTRTGIQSVQNLRKLAGGLQNLNRAAVCVDNDGVGEGG
jgi:hypothetical protein